jgi:hypothetical protein
MIDLELGRNMNLPKLRTPLAASLTPLALMAPLALCACSTMAAQSHPLASTQAHTTAPALSSRGIAANLASRLESDFVFPEQARRYTAVLNANANAGRYDSLSGVDLAAALTDDLQRVAPDGHLRVMHQGEGRGGGPQIVIHRAPGAPDGAALSDRQPIMVRMQPSPPIEEARWLAPGVAFVRFNLFPGETDVTDAVREFMTTHADADTIIFDLRTHMGGGLDEMDVIFPWLFSTPTRLVTMAARRSVDEAGGSPVGDGPNMRRVQGDPSFVTREHWVTPGNDARLFDARVFVLTSGFTGSAAEHFALAFKHTRRGTLIGRATYGANHFGGDQDLGGGFTAFIPVGRTYDSSTGADWEGVGVAPDIDVAPEAALIEALTLSGVSPEEAARLSAAVAPRGPMSSPRQRAG